MKPEQLDELEQLAKAATPGPRKFDSVGMLVGEPDVFGYVPYIYETDRKNDDYSLACAADPDTILALVEEVRKLDVLLVDAQTCADEAEISRNKALDRLEKARRVQRLTQSTCDHLTAENKRLVEALKRIEREDRDYAPNHYGFSSRTGMFGEIARKALEGGKS